MLKVKRERKKNKNKNDISWYDCGVLLGSFVDMQNIDLIFFSNFEHVIAWGLNPQCLRINTDTAV